MVAMFFKNVSGTDRLKLVFALPAAIVTHAYSLLGVAAMLYTFSANLLVPLVYFGIMDNLKIHHKNSVYILRRDNFHAFIGMAESASILEKEKSKIKRRNNYFAINFKGRDVLSTANSICSVYNEFNSKLHSVVNVRGKMVVDIGSYMGETALYYVIAGGADKVYSFEPVRSLYEQALKNIELNNLGGRIKVFNTAVLGKGDKNENSFGDDDSDTITLSKLVDDLNIKDGVLKIDCEGCEYAIIMGAPLEVLRTFSQIHIEYHYGYADIVDKLKAGGFSVNYTEPKLSIIGAYTGAKYMGDIIAIRVDKQTKHSS